MTVVITLSYVLPYCSGNATTKIAYLPNFTVFALLGVAAKTGINFPCPVSCYPYILTTIGFENSYHCRLHKLKFGDYLTIEEDIVY